MRPATTVTTVIIVLIGASAGAAYIVVAAEPIDPATLSATDGVLKVPSEACRAGPELPSRIPSRYVIHLIPLEGARLSMSTVASLQSSLDDAYSFLDFEATTAPPAKERGAMVIPAYVTVNNQLISPKGNPALGLECHNQIFLMHREGRTGVIASTVVHEVGHVLGLHHESNTWMHAQGTSWGIPPHAQHWNMDQFDYLLLWAEAGVKLPGPYA